MSKSDGPRSPANDPIASDAQPVAKRARAAAATAKSTGKTASIDDPDFETTVLKPRGVEFSQAPSQAYNQVPFQHFGTEIAPDAGKAAHYQKRLSHKIELFIDGGPSFNGKIEDEFTTTESWSHVERRYANLVMTFLLRQDRMSTKRKKARMFTAKKRDEEFILPIPKLFWYPPPIVHEDADTKHFDFNLGIL
ncbi:hypothetical protein DIS24_g10248 [Lasiodiplodia hormozganensis]|uniref:Uncharacterized protein n=1 Tax=Lasiodiplodia hormozganensis TaxID=869390 RepID=A0AA39XQT3_9PEZI|nr:hypothetical protein DIS24_g10248 [Lasiodiplodia hormozganensis]